MSLPLETNFVKTKYINPPIASLPLIFSNCSNFLNKFFAIKQNLKVKENKKVLITSKLRKFCKFLEILFQTIIRVKAKLLSSRDKVFRSQQN